MIDLLQGCQPIPLYEIALGWFLPSPWRIYFRGDNSGVSKQSARISLAVGVRRLEFFSWLTTDQMFAARKITSSLFFLPFVSSLGFALNPTERSYSVKLNRALIADDTSGKCNNKTQK